MEERIDKLEKEVIELRQVLTTLTSVMEKILRGQLAEGEEGSN